MTVKRVNADLDVAGTVTGGVVEMELRIFNSFD